MKSRTRQILATALVTSALSILIGGLTIWSTYESELNVLDSHFKTIVQDVALTPGDPVMAALLSVQENNFDVTLAFVTPSGEVATLKESRKAIIGSSKGVRIREIPIQAGEKLIVAASVIDIDKSLERNLWRLLLFILIANPVALFISILISRSGALVIERAHRKKMQEFLGDAAHELRTPLTVVKGYAELLEKKVLDGEREGLAFVRLNSEIKRMESLISDLLVLAELGEDSPDEQTRVDLSTLLLESIQDFQVVAPLHSIEMKISQGVSILASEKYVQRFIANALTNIRVHARPDVPIRVTLSSGKAIALIIEDGGVGLPAASYGEKIQGLKRFDRSRSRTTGGSGLGLSIMSAVIERSHGSLMLRKSDLGGLAIEVELPRT